MALGFLILHVTARSCLHTLGSSARPSLPVDSVALSPTSVSPLPGAPADTSADLVAPAAACRNATAGQSGLSSTLARCQSCPPLLCKCARLWPVSWRGGGRMPPPPGAASCRWMGRAEHSAEHPWLLHVDLCVSCEFSALLGAGVWHGKGGRGDGAAGAWLLP